MLGGSHGWGVVVLDASAAMERTPLSAGGGVARCHRGGRAVSGGFGGAGRWNGVWDRYEVSGGFFCTGGVGSACGGRVLIFAACRVPVIAARGSVEGAGHRTILSAVK